MRLSLSDNALIVELDATRRCLSSAVLGGGWGHVRTWVNVQVPPEYASTDPAADIGEVAARHPAPCVGMMTAVEVSSYRTARRGGAFAVATVGIGQAIAAAGRPPASVVAVGTINVLAVTDAALTDAALVGALQTMVEAKCQALAEAGIVAANADTMATGTATDSFCLACAPGASAAFAGPATVAGHDLAGAVHEAVAAGIAAWQEERA